MNKNTIITLAVIIILVLSAGLIYYFYQNKAEVEETPTQDTISITYKSTQYGFTFYLPENWQGYSIFQTTWNGTALNSTAPQSGPKLLIRNPKWTAGAPYEDLPILVFTIAQWNGYLLENFSVSAAPIPATELGRNNVYVFALPPRWNYDYSLGYQEATDIIAGNPLHPFNISDDSTI